MIMMNIIKIKNCLLILTVLISGCAGFQSNQVSYISPDLDFLVKSETMTYSITKDSTYGALGVFGDALISEMSNYGWSLKKSPTPISGVPHLNINLTLSKDPLALLAAALTGFTAYIIPSWETSNYKLTANFIDASGAEQYYELSDEIVLAQWLPLIVIFPFSDPFSAEGKVIGKMYNNLAYKVSKDSSLTNQLSNQDTLTQ